MTETLADQLKRLCCAETEGKFFDCVTDNIDTIISALRSQDALAQALQALVDQVNDYERVNNLAPNPCRAECWDTVAHAKVVLAAVAGSRDG